MMSFRARVVGEGAGKTRGDDGVFGGGDVGGMLDSFFLCFICNTLLLLQLLFIFFKVKVVF